MFTSSAYFDFLIFVTQEKMVEYPVRKKHRISNNLRSVRVTPM